MSAPSSARIRSELARRQRQLGLDTEFEVLHTLLKYDPATGSLTWRSRNASWFVAGNTTAASRARAWNRRYADKEALNSISSSGHLKGALLNAPAIAHRIAWALHHNEWPEHIDHINGNPADNRADNLRSVTHAENCRNFPRFKNNTSGITGVAKSGNAWAAFIGFGGDKRLGTFKTRDEAIAARKAAEERFGFHPNHGRIR